MGGPAWSDPPAAVASSGLRREWVVRGSTQASTLGDKAGQAGQAGRALYGHSLDVWPMQLAGCESSHSTPASPGAYRYAGERTLERFGPSALRTLLPCCPARPGHSARPPSSPSPPTSSHLPPTSLSLRAPTSPRCAASKHPPNQSRVLALHPGG